MYLIVSKYLDDILCYSFKPQYNLKIAFTSSPSPAIQCWVNIYINSITLSTTGWTASADILTGTQCVNVAKVLRRILQWKEKTKHKEKEEKTGKESRQKGL